MIITNRPEFIEKEKYDIAINKYLSRLKGIAGIVSVNTMGSVSSPGLSDIDVIVVVEDNFQLKKSTFLTVKGIDDRLFIHGPIIIPEYLAKNFQYIFYATDTRAIYGSDLLQTISDIPKDETRSLLFCYLIDFIESRFLQYSQVELAGEIDQRAWLARLWSITHSYDIFDQLGLSFQQEERDKLRLIKELRKDWKVFKCINDENFLQAYNFGYELNTLMFKMALDLAYSDKSFQERDNPGSMQLGNKKIYFNDIDSPKYKVKNYKVGRRNLTIYQCQQFKKYANHLSGYGFLKANDFTSSIISSHYSVMEKRKNYVSNHWKWLSKHALYADSMSGYLGLREGFSVGMKSSLRQFLEKISLGF